MISKASRNPDPRLLVAHLERAELEHVCELLASDPVGLRSSLKPLLIDPLWQYIQATSPADEGHDAATGLVEVSEDVLRHLQAGRLERAAWLAEKLRAAAMIFRVALSDQLLWQDLPRRTQQKKNAAKASAESRATDTDSKKALILKAAHSVRQTHPEKDVAGIVAQRVNASTQYVRRVLDKEKRT